VADFDVRRLDLVDDLVDDLVHDLVGHRVVELSLDVEKVLR
jgi:hypothetical protein